MTGGLWALLALGLAGDTMTEPVEPFRPTPLPLFDPRAAGTDVPEQTPSLFSMITPGHHHAEDIPGMPSGKWIALCPTPTGFELKTVTVRTRVAPSPRGPSDDDPDGNLGKLIEVDACSNARILLSGPGLRDGPVWTIATGSFPVGKELYTRLELGSLSYNMHTKQARLEDPVVVFLSQEWTPQPIAEIPGCCSDTWPSIVWAGDLDRDAKLDLLMNLSHHYAAGQLTLFLSSAATGESLLREVARISFTGC